MKKIFPLFVAVACCSMVFGQIISVTDGTLADWGNVPSEYLFKTECAPNASKDGLKSVQVYVDLTYINLLVEVNDDVVTDREVTPFHVFINSDNNAATGGFGDQWTIADTDLMFETLIFASGAVNPYNPAVFKWWGPNGENGWLWTDPDVEGTAENGWGALIPEGSMPIGNAQMVDGKIEIQLDYTLIPMPFDETTFTLGFDIQQSWTSVGVLPNAADDEFGLEVLAEKLRVYVHPQNSSMRPTIDGVQYKITSHAEPYTAEVFSSRNLDTNITEITIPETIVVDGITYTITNIGNYAFYGCSSLTSITIPNSVTSIGRRAFQNCSSLASITIPNSVTSIGEMAFDGCTSLTSVTIPNSVTSIGSSAFSRCYSLTSVTIPNSVISIGGFVFSSCSSLSSIIIPNSVTSVGDYAFELCSSLTSITIPNSVTSIGYGAFRECSSLSSITIPNSVTSIGSGAFYGCSSLSSMVVEEGNTTYDSRDNCNAIIETATNILIVGCGHTTIPNSVTSIGYGAFQNCSSLTSITIPNSVTSIGEHAFSWCSSLASITIPNSVTSVGYYAFYNCSSLASITIPNSVTSIGHGAFAGCSSLTSITIPNSVTSIGYWTFEDCSSLTSIKTEATTPPSLGSYVFPTNLKIIYIPDNTLSAYQQAWGDGYTYIHSGNSLTLHVEIPGTLSYLISDAGINAEMVARLILTGTLNDDDFTYMRETMTSLVDVDLSGITNTSGVFFRGKSNLVKIILPDNLTSIGEAAFRECFSLTAITIPNSVTNIEYYAFYDCYSLSSITIPNSVMSIGEYAFYDCYALSLVTLTAPSVEAFCNGQGNKLLCYAGCHAPRKIAINGEIITSITIPNSVTSIEDYAFDGCSSLTSITIPNSVTSIGDWAFDGCSSLTSITIPNSVTSIGDGAFQSCSSLASVTISNSVTSIGGWAFQNCSSLASITIPNSVTSIGGNAFYGCSSLNSIRVEATRPPQLGGEAVSASICYIPCGATFAYELSDWGYCVDVFVEVGCDICGDDLVWEYNDSQLSIAGYGDMYDYDIEPQPWQEYRNKITQISLPNGMTSVGASAFAECKYLKSVTIPSTVKKIHDSSFEDCRSLESVTFAGTALREIGDWAFYNCHSLKDITIPEGVTSIGKAAFFDCSHLNELTLPSTVQTIEDNAFGQCAQVKKMNVKAAVPPVVESETFEDIDRSIPVLVPQGTLKLYREAPYWQEFFNIAESEVMAGVENTMKPSTMTNCQKIIRDGNLVIIRDGVEYNVMGQQL